MKKMTKTLCLVLACLLLALSFAACSAKPPVDENKVFKMATNAAFPPYEY